MRNKALFGAAVCQLALAIGLIEPRPAASQESPFDWRSDWALAKGFALDSDTQGYHYPTAIAFVPQPGPAPSDPLYFVTELRGKVKVVTNDRSVHTFAEGFLKTSYFDEDPSREAEFGLAGLCLDPTHGYVFITFAYQDEQKLLHNNIVRFETVPETFAVAPTGQLAFTEMFADYTTGPSHQIGGCQVHEDALYVGIGDGFNSPRGSQQIDSMYGKIFRMTLDGKPLPDNPFYQDDDIKKPANFVWAYGLRNPFSLKFVADHLFVADNGPNVDRFVEIEQGANYLWDGTDQSAATNALAVIVPSRSPVQMDYADDDLTFFPEDYRRKFYVALAMHEAETQKIAGILMLDYGLEEGRMLGVPRPLLEYRGSGFQSVVGLALGPDGLYFASLLPNQDGQTAVYKITHDPERGHPYLLGTNKKPLELLYEKGCLGCHSISGQLKGGTAGPRLDQDELVARLETRLNSEAYVNTLAEIEQLDTEPQRSYRAARQEVLAAQGLDRVRVWIKYRIQEPRFDNTYTQMPNLGVTEQEAEILTEFLMTSPEPEGLAAWLPTELRYRHLIAAFGAGGLLGGLALAGAQMVLRRMGRRTKPRSSPPALPHTDTGGSAGETTGQVP